MKLSGQNIAFVGAGNMAEAIIGGLIPAGLAADKILIADPDTRRCKALQKQYGLKVAGSNAELVEVASVVVLAVKPQVMDTVLKPLASVLGKKQPLLISVAAGIPLALLHQWGGQNCPLIRVMPNTPALVREGVSGLYAEASVSAEYREMAEQILRAVGEVVWVDSEALIDSVTAVSGSGPAYFFYMIEALEAAAREQGLDGEQARLLALETAYGAAKLARKSVLSPEVLRERVTSPGGTTEAALKSFQQSDFIGSVSKAVRAAAERSRELAALAKKRS